MRFLHEVGIAHRVECTHHVRALEIRFRRRTDAFFFRLLQQVLAVATGNRVGRVDHDLARELGTVILGKLRDRLVGHGHQDDIAKVQRVSNRSSLGKRAEAIGQRLQLFRMAR